MSKVEEFKDTFKCNFCKRKLDMPIILPCGETICRKDLPSFFINANKCSFCDEAHEQLEKGFPSNKNIQKLLDLQVDQLNFCQNHIRYKECKSNLNDLEKKLQEIHLIEKNPENFVHDYFENIINQVVAQRETVIEQVHFHSEKTIETIRKTRDECLLEENQLDSFNSTEYQNMKDNVSYFVSDNV